MTLPGIDVSTPLMQQYREIKARHRDAILLFRMGDFYEMFEDDAEVGARTLGLTLTSRNNGGAAETPLAGVPVKAASAYIKRLVERGFRVAICEQVEDPKLAKGIVRREVIEVVTPGAVMADDLLEERRNTFLVALASDADRTGLAAADLSTGEFVLESGPAAALEASLQRYNPSEVIVPEGGAALAPQGVLVTRREPWEFDPALASEDLARRFELASLDGLGLGPADALAVGAAGALLRYLTELQPGGLPQLRRPTARRAEGQLHVDAMTRRNLELVEPLRPGADDATLLAVVDRTMTPMGARLLRAWLLAPLTDPAAIARRLDAVAALLADEPRRAAMREALDGVRDVERLGAKAAARRATPRDLGALRTSLERLPPLAAVIGDLYGLATGFDLLEDLAAALSSALVDRPPAALGDGDVIRPGHTPALDELRALRDGGRAYIASLQARERARTGIGSLKVGYNKVFGYYIEVTRANKDAVPADYERRQTLTGAERYVTPELKAYEAKVLGAEEEIASLEERVFVGLREEAGRAIRRIQDTAARVAAADVLASLAEVAARNGYTRPEVVDGFALEIEAGRHPVVERMMPREAFIPNDLRLDAERQIMIVTGPNMAGKSTVLRQAALLVILAQAGSFVPARAARIGVVDRLFTRVGASDDLARGQSTFLVEMSETASILHNATRRSLVLLDEIGRGTSTYDGVAIAWAVAEHLHERVGCKAVFATHYHELTQLAERYARIVNFNVAVHESGDDVIFLHRLRPGGADRSYGIHVGRLAGLPAEVLDRARAVLRSLEAGHRVAAAPSPADQLALFAPPESPVLAELRALDLDGLTPREALARLADLQRRARGGTSRGPGKETQ
ncbi:MAG TPA: DNA mismatch repair protein MutS [Gemmatimonadales bacterium]|nr:DNA mismatch repair protein MutS [Gemmatimonadales bacterium]